MRLGAPDLVGRAVSGSGNVALRLTCAAHDQSSARLDLRRLRQLALHLAEAHLDGLQADGVFVEIDVEAAQGFGFTRQARLQGSQRVRGVHIVEAGEVLRENGELLRQRLGLRRGGTAGLEQTVHGQRALLHLLGRAPHRVAGLDRPALNVLRHRSEGDLEGRLHFFGVDGHLGHLHADSSQRSGQAHRQRSAQPGHAAGDALHILAEPVELLLCPVQPLFKGDGIRPQDNPKRANY